MIIAFLKCKLDPLLHLAISAVKTAPETNKMSLPIRLESTVMFGSFKFSSSNNYSSFFFLLAKPATCAC